MSFFGKTFVLDSQENFDGFVNSFGSDVSAEVKQALINHKGTVKLTKDGDQYVFESSKPFVASAPLVFKSGVEFDEQLKEGVNAKTTITVNGNTMTQVQKFADGIVFTTTREFSDNQVVTTIKSTAWDGVAKRIYKAA